MEVYSGLLSKDIINGIEKSLRRNGLIHYYYLNEYKFITKDQHIQYITSQLNDVYSRNSFVIYVNVKDKKEACAILSVSDFDSSVFEFKVASIEYLFLSDFFYEGIHEVFKQIVKLSKKEAISYINFSVNTNDPNCQNIVNVASQYGFYFINTLIVFGYTKDTFHNLDLKFTTNPEIIIRNAVDSDFTSLSNIAEKSFKLDKYHLDNKLSKDKCDKLYADSFYNSFYNGFADEILVAEYQGIPIGYSTIKVKQINDLKIKVGLPIIAAVSENYRGLGAYEKMEKERIRRLYQHSDIAEFGTYINNFPVHSVLIKSKMKLVKGIMQFALINN